MCHKGRICAAGLLGAPAFDGGQRARQNLGKCFNTGGGNRWVFNKGFPRLIAFIKLIVVLAGPVSHIDVHQVWFKLDGELARLRDNLGCLTRPFQWAANHGADGENRQGVGQALRLLLAGIGE